MSDEDTPAESFDEEPLILRISDENGGGRLDKVLAGLLSMHSRSRLQGWIEAGRVCVNGVVAKVRTPVGPDDELTVWPMAAPQDSAFVAQADVVFTVAGESPDWIVIDKPAGLVTHPGAGNWQGTLLNGLLSRFPELAGVPRAGIVHRLDKDTSGLLVVARNETAQTAFVRQLQRREMGREYLALGGGWLKSGGTVDRAIGRDARVPVRMSVERPVAPKPAITHYEPRRLGSADGQAPVSEFVCRLETGRTHQIRVHMASIGHPLLGDTLYGGRPLAGAPRQMLHARRLRFVDLQGIERSFEAAVPQDMQTVMETITWL